MFPIKFFTIFFYINLLLSIPNGFCSIHARRSISREQIKTVDTSAINATPEDACIGLTAAEAIGLGIAAVGAGAEVATAVQGGRRKRSVKDVKDERKKRC